MSQGTEQDGWKQGRTGELVQQLWAAGQQGGGRKGCGQQGAGSSQGGDHYKAACGTFKRAENGGTRAPGGGEGGGEGDG